MQPSGVLATALCLALAMVAMVRRRHHCQQDVRKKKKPATVFLVGAGPGPLDLITVRGLRLVESCQAIVTDRLVSPALVQLAQNRGAFVVNVGKSSTKERLKQESIEEILVALAYELGEPNIIVRLKGGDPFVYGLGGNEVLTLGAAAVPCVVVPGLSSALAIPTLYNIPLTHKNTSAGFVVLSGHAGCEGEEWLQLPRVKRPVLQLVVLMIAKNLEVITTHLRETLEWDSSLPVRLVQNGATDLERILASTLGEVAFRAQQEDLVESPLILVVGDSCGILPPNVRNEDVARRNDCTDVWGRATSTIIHTQR